jgi:hypothetical protein
MSGNAASEALDRELPCSDCPPPSREVIGCDANGKLSNPEVSRAVSARHLLHLLTQKLLFRFGKGRMHPNSFLDRRRHPPNCRFTEMALSHNSTGLVQLIHG